MVGKIDALREGVSAWTLGQRVGVGFLGGHCGVCNLCRRGDPLEKAAEGYQRMMTNKARFRMVIVMDQ